MMLDYIVYVNCHACQNSELSWHLCAAWKLSNLYPKKKKKPFLNVQLWTSVPRPRVSFLAITDQMSYTSCDRRYSLSLLQNFEGKARIAEITVECWQ